VLSSKFEGGWVRSVATGHSVCMGEDEEMEIANNTQSDTQSAEREVERSDKEIVA